MKQILKIAFGTDQAPHIDKVLKEMKDRVVKIERSKHTPLIVDYTITFKDVNDVYVFGYSHCKIAFDMLYESIKKYRG